MSNQVPEKLIGFRVYLEGTEDLLGVADVTLPDMESMTETVKGAGIAGEFESPTLGHFKAMTCTLNWRTKTAAFMKLSAQKVHHLDVREAIQVLDAGEGKYVSMPCKIVLRGVPKKVALGKLEVGAQQDASTELGVSYIKITLDGSEALEFDVFNFVYRVNGDDLMADVRTALGLA